MNKVLKKVEKNEIEEVKSKFKISNSIETSAKTGENIEAAFLNLVQDIYRSSEI